MVVPTWVPQKNYWFIRENAIEMEDESGYPHGYGNLIISSQRILTDLEYFRLGLVWLVNFRTVVVLRALFGADSVFRMLKWDEPTSVPFRSNAWSSSKYWKKWIVPWQRCAGVILCLVVQPSTTINHRAKCLSGHYYGTALRFPDFLRFMKRLTEKQTVARPSWCFGLGIKRPSDGNSVGHSTILEGKKQWSTELHWITASLNVLISLGRVSNGDFPSWRPCHTSRTPIACFFSTDRLWKSMK